MSTLEKMLIVVKVIHAIIHQKFIKVSEIAIFLNALIGTTSITGEKIDMLLVKANYQLLSDDVKSDEIKLADGYIADTKFIPTKQAEGWYEVIESYTENEEKFCILQWRADLLLELLGKYKNADIQKLASAIIVVCYNNNLINIDKEIVDPEVLMKNIEYFRKYYKDEKDESWF